MASQKFDYIIVGFGLAGAMTALELARHKKSFLVIDSGKESASQAAAGVVNPVILKRFTLTWKAAELMETFGSTLDLIKRFLGDNFFDEFPLLRVLHDEAEQESWINKSENPPLSRYLNSNVMQNISQINAPHGLGLVNETGLFRVREFLEAFKKKLKEFNIYRNEEFNYSDCNIHDDHIDYNNYSASKIIFAEGWGIKKNPFFNWINLQGNKGEALIIKSENLPTDLILKSKHFLFELEDESYYLGATYNPKDKDWQPTEKSKKELLNSLQKITDEPIELEEHRVGIRPTTHDRRMIVGSHPEHNNLLVINGLGARGVLNSGFVARQLIENSENNKPIDSEINCLRFWNK